MGSPLDLASSLLAAGNPATSAIGSITGALGGSPSSSAKGGNVSGSPVTVNVAGFGSKASGSAKSSATGSDEFPAAGGVAYPDETGATPWPSWFLPAAVGLVLVFVVIAIARKH